MMGGGDITVSGRLRDEPAVRAHHSLDACDPLLRRGVDAGALIAQGAAGIVYVATPYSRVVTRPDGSWCWHLSALARDRAVAATVPLVRAGMAAFSPVALAAQMCHRAPDLDPLDGVFWERWCAPFLAAAALVWVPDIAGWRESDGVSHEIAVALARNKPVRIEAPDAAPDAPPDATRGAGADWMVPR